MYFLISLTPKKTPIKTATKPNTKGKIATKVSPIEVVIEVIMLTPLVAFINLTYRVINKLCFSLKKDNCQRKY